MIKKLALGFVVVFVMFSCGTNTQSDTKEEKSEMVELAIGDLLENPENYVDKPVLISGLVDHVCREGGKKLFIVDQNPDHRLKITVGKDIPSFDVELEGNDILVEGVFRELVVDEEYLAKWEDELTAKQDSISEGHAQTESGEMVDQGQHEGDMAQITSLREQLETSGKEKLSFYSVECSKITAKEDNE